MPLGAIVGLISMKIIMGSNAGFSITAHNGRRINRVLFKYQIHGGTYRRCEAFLRRRFQN